MTHPFMPKFAMLNGIQNHLEKIWTGMDLVCMLTFLTQH